MPQRIPTHRPNALPAAAIVPRLTAGKRGYDYTWQQFREWFGSQVPAICGARAKVRPDGMLEPIFPEPGQAIGCGAALASRKMALDHIVPLDQGGERLDPENTGWLCPRCHAKKTARDKKRIQE